MQYELEIETAAGTVRLALDDLDLTGKTASLFAFLQKCAGPISLKDWK
jgi:hypothetical protein